MIMLTKKQYSYAHCFKNGTFCMSVSGHFAAGMYCCIGLQTLYRIDLAATRLSNKYILWSFIYTPIETTYTSTETKSICSPMELYVTEYQV